MWTISRGLGVMVGATIVAAGVFFLGQALPDKQAVAQSSGGGQASLHLDQDRDGRIGEPPEDAGRPETSTEFTYYGQHGHRTRLELVPDRVGVTFDDPPDPAAIHEVSASTPAVTVPPGLEDQGLSVGHCLVVNLAVVTRGKE